MAEEETESKFKLRLLRQCASQLMEHFDSCEIICTTHDEESGSFSYCDGKGSMYARYGSVREWLVHAEEEMRHQVSEDTPEDE